MKARRKASGGGASEGRGTRRPGAGAGAARKSGAGARRGGGARARSRAGPLEAPEPPEEGGPVGGGEIRLNKFLADRGIASRRRCDELIASGKVMLDGRVVTELGTKLDPERQVVEVDGVLMRGHRRRYYLLNKPKGVVCTSEARESRPRAVDLITDPEKGRIYTVGRLDEKSEGLILLTNDGEFANRMMHPRYGMEKTYAVKIDGRVEDESLAKIRGGMHLAEGRTSGARVVVLRRGREHSLLEITLREGMNREIRRSFARIGHKVLELRRVRIGPLNDRGLRKPGHWRRLGSEEVQGLLSWRPDEQGAMRRHPAARGARVRATGRGGSGAGREERRAGGASRARRTR